VAAVKYLSNKVYIFLEKAFEWAAKKAFSDNDKNRINGRSRREAINRKAGSNNNNKSNSSLDNSKTILIIFNRQMFKECSKRNSHNFAQRPLICI